MLMAEILLHRNAARKQWKSARRIHGNGLEAPRNSLDLPLYDNIMTVRQNTSRGSTPQEKTTAKNVISKDFPSQPSVIARLMGMDTIPVPAAKDAVVIHAQETSNLKLQSTMDISVTSPRSSAPFRQSKCSLISYRSSSGDYRHCLKKMRPRRARFRQHHPQEELLEKIKEDFQAWQTTKALENARTVAASGSSSSSSKSMEGRYIQMLAQENLHKEKMAKYGYRSKISMEEKDTLKNATKSAAESKPEDKVVKVLKVSHCAAAATEKVRDLEDEPNHSTSEKSRSPARIVILKPSSGTGACDQQEPLFSSSKVKREGNMEEFLREVKERLEKELKVKAKGEVIRTSWGTDPKQIARDIAAQIRETVSMQELGQRLSRSESFRAFRSDRKCNAAAARNASPEHVALRLKTVISRTETVLSPQEEKQGHDGSYPIRSGGTIKSLADTMPLSVPGTGLDEQSCTTSSSTARVCRVDDVAPIDADVVPPRALIRSLSAPASGISHQDMLFAADSVASGRYENSDAVSEGAAVASKNSSSSSFSLRGTVSNLRHSFSSRANRLLGRKTHWSKKPSLGEKSISMPPSPAETFRLVTVAQDNFTELPPSPVSPLEVKGNSSRHFFSDLNCTLPELSPKSWSEMDAPRPSNGSSCRSRTNIHTETESYPDMDYIKQVLVAAGLYDDGSSSPISQANADSISMARPICCDHYIFQEVEEAYYSCYYGDTTEENAMDHRMLFDLVNEALEILERGVRPGSSLRRWLVDGAGAGVSPGRKLVDDVWQQVQALRVQEMQTVDSIVAREAWKSAWTEALYEDAYVLGKMLERAIFDELIDGIVQDLFI